MTNLLDPLSSVGAGSSLIKHWHLQLIQQFHALRHTGFKLFRRGLLEQSLKLKVLFSVTPWSIRDIIRLDRENIFQIEICLDRLEFNAGSAAVSF